MHDQFANAKAQEQTVKNLLDHIHPDEDKVELKAYEIREDEEEILGQQLKVKDQETVEAEKVMKSIIEHEAGDEPKPQKKARRKKA